MKYEIIFGDEKLFDYSPDDAVLASVQLGDFRYFTEENLQSCKKFNIYKLQACDTQLAMRRIIQEPKRWTAEDQKAGRLPQVGAIIGITTCRKSYEFVGVDANPSFWHVKNDKGEMLAATVENFKPLETPEEKAERLRGEWINEAITAVQKTDNNGYESIYDALLSGALSVPTKGCE